MGWRAEISPNLKIHVFMEELGFCQSKGKRLIKNLKRKRGIFLYPRHCEREFIHLYFGMGKKSKPEIGKTGMGREAMKG